MKKKIENMIADAFVESLKKFDWSTLERGLLPIQKLKRGAHYE